MFTYIYASLMYRGAEKTLARPRRKQTLKHARDARDFNNIETLAVTQFFSLQGKAPKEIHAILTETLACFLPGRAKDLSAPLYSNSLKMITIDRNVSDLSRIVFKIFNFNTSAFVGFIVCHVFLTFCRRN